MATLDIKVSLSDSDFDATQRRLVQETLGKTTQKDFEDALARLFKSAALEYINMFVEKGLASRADEVRQDRLYFLISHYYQNDIPSQTEVASIFLLTQSQSGTLMRNTRSRYRTKISIQVKAAAKKIVADAEKNEDSGRWEMLIPSDVIREELNLTIALKDPKLKPVRLKKDSSAWYEADQDTYDLLKAEYP
jgi:hypothetical protein